MAQRTAPRYFSRTKISRLQAIQVKWYIVPVDTRLSQVQNGPKTTIFRDVLIGAQIHDLLRHNLVYTASCLIFFLDFQTSLSRARLRQRSSEVRGLVGQLLSYPAPVLAFYIISHRIVPEKQPAKGKDHLLLWLPLCFFQMIPRLPRGDPDCIGQVLSNIPRRMDYYFPSSKWYIRD
jgi:hypothetical protein